MTDSKHTEENQKKIEFDINKLKADGKNIEIIEDKNIALIEYNGKVDNKHFLLNVYEISEIKESTVFSDTMFRMKNGDFYFTSTPYNIIKEELSKCGFIIKG